MGLPLVGGASALDLGVRLCSRISNMKNGEAQGEGKRTICQQIVFFALRLRKQTVSFRLLVFTSITHETAKYLLECMVDIYGATFLAPRILAWVQIYS